MFEDLIKAIDQAQADYDAQQATGTRAQRWEAGRMVQLAKRALAEAIAAGAPPCPLCGKPPVGMMQPIKDVLGSRQFEVGCATCPNFTHLDGTTRRVAGRGPLPRHAVEVWAAGPDFWVIKP